MKVETKKWLSLAQEDKEMMDLAYTNRKYSYAVLFAQQAVEKMIKAHIIETTEKQPRKIHHLEKLIQDTNLDLDQIDSPALEELSKAYSRVRYPDIGNKYYESKKEVEPLIQMAQKIYLWIENILIHK